MMNKKGQTLILFVLLLPLLILLMAFVVDTGLVLKERTRLNSVTKTILKTTFYNRMDGDYQEKVTELFHQNNIPIEHLIIEVEENIITIQNEYQKESTFGSIIGIKDYKIKGVLKAKLENERIKIEKE